MNVNVTRRYGAYIIDKKGEEKLKSFLLTYQLYATPEKLLEIIQYHYDQDPVRQKSG